MNHEAQQTKGYEGGERVWFRPSRQIRGESVPVATETLPLTTLGQLVPR